MGAVRAVAASGHGTLKVDGCTFFVTNIPNYRRVCKFFVILIIFYTIFYSIHCKVCDVVCLHIDVLLQASIYSNLNIHNKDLQ